MAVTAAAIAQKHIALSFGLVLELGGIDGVDHASGVDCAFCFSI